MVRAAILKVDEFGSEFADGIDVISCDYSFSQQINARGEPAGIPQGGTINLMINSVNSSTIMSWMFGQIQMSGSITFSDTGDRDGGVRIFKTLKFELAYLVSYHESFSGSDSGIDMTTSLTISAKKITVSDKTHENLWTIKND